MRVAMRGVFRWSMMLMLVGCVVGPLYGATVYVDAGRPDDSGDGLSWASAKQSVQAGVDAAGAGDTVLVTNGTYLLASEILVSTAITVESVNGAEVTIVDGQGACRGFHLGSAACTISGFTVTNGYTSGRFGSGGGIYCSDTTPVIEVCLLTGSKASLGGGAYAGTLSNCTLSGNTAWSSGGGSYNGTLSGCTVSGNVANRGGGSYDGTLNSCTLSGNVADTDGGGSYGGTLNNCTLRGNVAVNDGGGSYGGTLNSCMLRGNASDHGGGGSYATLNSCTLSGNTASYGGGSDYGMLNSCTLSGNTGTWYGGGSYRGTLNNCVIYYNEAPNGSNYWESAVAYSCSAPLPSGTGNISDVPLFVDVVSSNFHLEVSSPCRDAGDNSAVVGSTDLDGNRRIVNTTVDMGAYEFLSDFGDLPASYSLSLLSDDGAQHGRGSIYLGGLYDGENNGTESAVAEGDDDDGVDDEDGIVVASAWAHSPDGGRIEVTVTGGDGYLSGWIDWDGNDQFSDAGDQILDMEAVGAGSQTVTFDVPADAFLEMGTYTNFARFRLWTNATSALTVTGLVDNGEVEDYRLVFSMQLEHTNSSPVHYVAPSGTAIWPYTTWGTAATNIQDAIDAAASGDTVQVTNGAYQLASTIIVAKPITIESVNGPEVTIVDGQGSCRGFDLGNSACAITGFTVTNGYATGNGGGISCTGTNPVITRCLLSGNTSMQVGGGAIYGRLNSCVLIGNTASSGGGASDGVLNNCTLSGNAATSRGGGSYDGTLNNCIVYYNEAAEGSNYWGSAFSYSCSAPLPSGTGNISDSPQFTDVLSGNLRPLSFSRCIDVGDDGAVTDPIALDGNARILSGTVDMGAYEFVAVPDFGDLPASYGLTTQADDGAMHNPGTVILGRLYDGESDGIESAAADGDDGDGADDEDGIVVSGSWVNGSNGGRIEVTVTGGDGYLSGWIDWDGNDQFSDAGDQILDMAPVGAGSQTVTFDVPPDAFSEVGSYTNFARFRLWISAMPALTVTGLVDNGEVEDYRLTYSVPMVIPMHYVSTNGGAVWPYSSWDNAATNIQDAIDASHDGDSVSVASGTYALTAEIMVTNAITVASIDGAEVTIVDGQGACRGFNLGNSACTISGFTVTNGYTTGDGGGISCTGTIPVINSCRLIGNVAELSNGGGSYFGTLNNCTLSGNTASRGGGSSDGTLNRCTLSGNTASFGGGSRRGTLNNCILSGNTASSGGGASGGTLNGCVFSGNTASSGGGAWDGKLNSCTLSGNTAVTGGGSWRGRHNNCIVYHNSAPDGPNYYEGTFAFSCTSPLPLGTGNIDTPPLLTALDNPHLLQGSPCIDSGSSALAVGGADIDGEARISGVVDMGCDEFAVGSQNGPLGVGIATPLGTEIVIGYPLAFGSQVEGLPLSLSLDLGDGTVVTNLCTTNHTFSNVGIYTVTLQAVNLSHVVSTSIVVQVFSESSAALYVSPAGDDANSGICWDEAKQTIQAGIDAALVGASVLVSNGTYQLTSQIAVTQSMTVKSVNGASVTIIDCQDSCRGFNLGDAACTVSGFTVINGYTTGNGGGISCTGTNPVITHCTLTGNRATRGGGSYFGTLTHCALIGNLATQIGGGADFSTLDNCILRGNGSFSGGGSHGGTLNNCTVSGNWVTSQAGGVYYGTLNNCIVFGNSGGGVTSNSWGCTFSHSCIAPPSSGTGNISLPPQFVDSASGDYRLQESSPCVNAGNNSLTVGGTDLDGNPRIVGGPVDMGAYEVQIGWIDSDGDGIADEWEVRYFGGSTNCVASGNSDQDPQSNLEEYIAGMDPTNAASYFSIIQAQQAGDELVLRWPAVSNRLYSVWWTPCLTNAFQCLASGIEYPQDCYTTTVDSAEGCVFHKVGVEVK